MFDSLLLFCTHGLLDFSWWQLVVVTFVITHATIVGVTVYLHRCQAHRALTLHPAASHSFRFWLWLTTGVLTSQWVAIHRKHHAKCETIEDPHSPQTLGILKVLFEGAELYRSEVRNEETMRLYSRGTPNDWLERSVYARYPNLGISIMMVIDVTLFGIPGLTLWAVQMLWIPLWAAGVINGLGHWWGYRNFNSADASTNIFPFGALIGGEELHNNHHAYPTSAKLSCKWYELDIGWGYIRILAFLGLAKVKRIAPMPHLSASKPEPDYEMLQAILTNRYEVMARYAKMFKCAYRQEVSTLRRTGARERYQRMVAARDWLFSERTAREEMQHEKWPLCVRNDPMLRRYVEMEWDLYALWARSNATRDELLIHLRAWCLRAEESGVESLAEFSKRLRRYA
jgi:stearoyl-CoA desaturase (delta-9 desaturase)